MVVTMGLPIGLSVHAAPGDLTFTAGTATKDPGDLVEIPITVSDNNNGLDFITMTVTFDSTRLEWQNLGAYIPGNITTHPWTHGGYIPWLSTPGSIGTNTVTLNYMDMMGVWAPTSGTLITLKLKVKDSAPAGDASITLSCSLVSDSRGSISAYNLEDGKVTVSGAAEALTGTASIDNTSPKIGDTLTGSYTLGNNTGTLTYTWKSGATTLGTGTTYTVLTGDLGNTITLEVTSDVETGSITSGATSAVVKKTGPSAPSAPTLDTKTHNSVTLTANALYEFSDDASIWQASNVFSGLSPNTAYTFYQRVAATADTLESAASAVFNVTTDLAPPDALTGTATIDNTSPKIGDVLTGSLVSGNNTGTLTYTWKSGATVLQTGAGTTYTVLLADLGNTITLEITSTVETGTQASAATSAVAKKSAPAAPGTPTLVSKTHDTVTLTANALYEFSNDGTTWQTSNVFSSLSGNTAYTFYQRVAATADTLESDASSGLTETTDPTPPSVLAGTATISNTSPRIGDMLTGSLVSGNNTGILTYTWKTGATVLGTGATYTVLLADLGNTITLEITSSIETGTRTSADTAAVLKKAAPSAPAAPTLDSKTHNSIVLDTIAGAEYRVNAGAWQSSPTFTGLSPNTSYTFTARIAETSDTLPSAVSAGFTTSTNALPVQTVTFGTPGTVSKTYGDSNFTNAATAPGTITYSSSDTSVATINSSTGEVTILKAGSTTITATATATDDYSAGTSSYSLTVNKAALTIKPKNVSISRNATMPIPEVEYVGLKYTDVGATAAILSTGTLSMEIRNAANTGTLANTATAGTYKIIFDNSPTFSSDNYNVTIADGTLTITSSGSTVYPTERPSTHTPAPTTDPNATSKPTNVPTSNSFPFNDVKTSDWFFGDVKYAYENGLFNGMSHTAFEPYTSMTRAMLVTVLWRMAGSPNASGTSFTDVKSSEWYSAAVAWAGQNKIVEGIGDNLFAPNSSITRQDLATMIMRYISFIKFIYVVNDEYRIFADEKEISSYAKNAIQNLNKLGIMNGRGNNVIDPRGAATRAEVAAMLHRLAEMIK